MSFLTLLAVAFASALVPVVNLEVYLGGTALLGGSRTWWQVAVLAAVAAVGQMAGKTLFYLAGRGVLTLPRRLRAHAVVAGPAEQPVAQPRRERSAARLARWQEQLERRRWLSVVFVGTSASVGLPPFAIVSVVAGSLRIPLPVFVLAGLVGRWVRFVAVLALVQASTG